MEQLETTGISGIREIITKLIKSKRYSDLTPEEIAYLSEFTGIKQADKEIEPAQTLFSWIWPGLFKYGRYAGAHSIFDISQFDGVINKESERNFSSFPSGQILCTLLSRSDIIKAIRESIQLRKLSLIDHHERIEGAACLTGMAGLYELEKELIEICLEKPEDSFTYKIYSQEIISAAFISLIMLNSKSIETIYNRIKTLADDAIKSALLFYYDLFPDKIPEDKKTELHDFFSDFDDAFKFSNLTLKLFSNDIKGLNNLISSKYCESGSELMWDFICPAVYSLKNKKLLHKIIEDNEAAKVHRVLMSAVLEKAEWILPLIMKKINSREKETNGYSLKYMLPYYIITAGALSRSDCDWLRPFFNDPDENIRVSAILSCIGKDQFRNDLDGMKNDAKELINPAITFVLALSEDYPLAYYDSLVLEMVISHLDHEILPYLYCLVKSFTDNIPLELQNIWYMTGPFNKESSVKFYNSYPYMLISWVNEESRKRPRQSFVSSDDVAERFVSILMEIDDPRLLGLYKSLLYIIDIEPLGIFLLSKVIELEGNGLSTETKALKKIFLSEENKPFAFEKDEIFYAILFYYAGRLNKKSAIISGINSSSEIVDVFLRLVIETGNSYNADHALKACLKQEDSTELLIREIQRIDRVGKDVPIDKITFSRIIATNSDEYRTGLLGRYVNSSVNDHEGQSKVTLQLTDEDIHLLVYLFGDNSANIMRASLDGLASNIDKVKWLKESIKRWFNTTKEDSGYLWSFTDAALRAASMIKSEEYLPAFINLANRDGRFVLKKEEILTVMEEILSNNPDSKFIMLRADNPDFVEKKYSLTVKREIKFDRDYKADSVILITQALGRLADASFVKEHIGKTLSINHEKDQIDPALIQKCLTRSEFEKLALYLTVTYTDEGTGLIFAEVMDPAKSEPSSEILNAILQSNDFAVFTVSWN